MIRFILCALTIAPSIFAGPFDWDSAGDSGIYVSVKDENANEIEKSINGNTYTYKQYIAETKKIRNAKISQRFIYSITNLGENKVGDIIGKITITSASNNQKVGEFYYRIFDLRTQSERNQLENEYNIDKNEKPIVNPTGYKRALIDTSFPHRKATFKNAETGEESSWTIFFPWTTKLNIEYIKKNLNKRGKDALTCQSSFVIYCPKTGFVDFIAADAMKYNKKDKTSYQDELAKHPFQ